MIRVVKRGSAGAWNWSAGSPARRTGVALAGAGLAAAIAFTWWPNGDYKPIQPGEQGTLTSAFTQLSNVTSGRAALTAQRERQLGGAPTQRQLQRNKSKHGQTQQKPGSKPKQGSTSGGGSGAGSSGQQPQSGGGLSDPQTSTDPSTTAPSQGGTSTDPSATPPASTTPQQPPPDQQAPSGSGSDGTATTTTPAPTPTTPTSP
jgi:hypothetical protein